jgi:subtilisin family serine protease
MAILLILALALSYLSLAPPVLAPAVVSHPGGTVVEVVQGDIFTLRFRLRWDGAAPGYFAIAVSWDSPRLDNSGAPSENFTFVSAKACFDNGDEIYTEAVSNEGPAPENENVWRYAVAVRHSEGDPRNGEFNVDVVLRAAGANGVLHVPTENHPIRIVGSMDVPEDTFYSYSPPNPYITIRVLKERNPTDDATVRSDSPGQNFGSENGLKVYNTPGGEGRAFLRFSLASLPPGVSITSAKLRLYCYEMDFGWWPMEVHAVENDAWSENAITWNSQPPLGALLDTYEGAAGEWWGWDVTSFAAGEFSGDKVVSLCLVASPEQEAYFYSKEAALNRPHLEIAYTLPEGGTSSTSEIAEENTASAGAVSPSTGDSGSEDPLTAAFREKALEHVSRISGRPIEEFEVYEAWANFPLTGRRIYSAKVMFRNLGQKPYLVYVDENGEILDDGAMRKIELEEREAAFRRYGKLEPALWESLQSKGQDEVISCTIWIKQMNPIPPAPNPFEFGSEEEFNKEFAKYEQMLRDYCASWQKPVVDFLSANGFHIKYVSRYAPVMFADLPKWMILKLQERPEVDTIYLAKTYEPAGDSAAATMRARRVWDEGITGAGVRVAVLEAGGNIYFGNPYLTDGLTYNPEVDPSTHATAVAGIVASTHSKIRGIAYGAPGLLSACPAPFDLDGIIAAAEWAIDNGAFIINNSWGFNTKGQMDDTARYFDRVVRYSRRTVVCAAGNERYPYGIGKDNYVISPAIGYNAIAVGAIDDHDTDNWDDDAMAEYSSFRDPISQYGDREKPELVAVGSAKPGEKRNQWGWAYQDNDCRMKSTTMEHPWVGYFGDYGTSFSSPAVAGAAALLMQENQDLKYWPEVIKAVLMASAVHNVEGESRLSEYDGAGAVVLSTAYETVKLRRMWGRTVFQQDFPVHYQFDAKKGQRVRIAIAWSSDPDSSYPPSDLDLGVSGPGGRGWSSSSYDNPYEIVDFIAPADGTYMATIQDTRLWLDFEYLGFAYCITDFLERSETTFELENLYKARLTGYLYLYRGFQLVAKFYTYDNAYQAEGLVWGEPTLPYAYFNTAVPHPQGKPIERVRLVLVDSAGNQIATVVTFTATRSVLLGRISKIKSEWPYADAARRSALLSEISGIKSRWPYAPT